MEAVAAGRADYAATLADLGFVPRSYVDALRGQARGQVCSGVWGMGAYVLILLRICWGWGWACAAPLES
jgi:hypothetical protein